MMHARFLGIALAALSILSAGGCEALVGDSLPSTINCVGTSTTSCPAGQQCTSGTCQPCPGGHCGPIFLKDAGVDVFVAHDSGHDVGVDHFVVETKDTGIDVGVAPGLGDPCSSAGPACTTGLFCLDAQDLPGLTFPGGTSICSATCCSDADCSGGTCYPTAGGNYCLSATLASTKCGDSGCGKACCTTTRDCGGQDTCGLSAGVGGAPVPQCGQSGTGQPGDFCQQDSDCMSSICSAGTGGGCGGDSCACADAVDCCGPMDCTGGATCNWLETTDPMNTTLVFRGCQAPGGTRKANESCTNTSTGNDCEGSICATFGSSGGDVCSQPCCTDADCQTTPEISTWVCRPFNAPLAAGSIELLVCQPPASTES